MKSFEKFSTCLVSRTRIEIENFRLTTGMRKFFIFFKFSYSPRQSQKTWQGSASKGVSHSKWTFQEFLLVSTARLCQRQHN